MHSQYPPVLSVQQLVIFQEQSEDDVHSFEINLCLIASVVVDVGVCVLFSPMIIVDFLGKLRK